MYDYRLTQNDLLVMFFNSISVSDKLGYKSPVLKRMIKELYLRVGDARKLIGETRPKIPVPGYTTPDGKSVVLDEEYFSEELQRFDLSGFTLHGEKVDEKILLQSLIKVIQQSEMDHELLGHSYSILSSKIEKLRRKIGKELNLKKTKSNDYEKESQRILLKRTEMIAYETQIKCANYRMKVCQNELTKRIWETWIIILKKQYNSLKVG